MTELAITALAVAAWVFGGSAIAKLRSRRAFGSFQAGLAETALLPSGCLRPAAAALAGAELVISVLALAALGVSIFAAAPGALSAIALAGGALLASVLTTGIVLVLRRGTVARCACFGSTADLPLGKPHLARNLTLLALLLAGLAGSALSGVQPGQAAALLAVAAGAVLALLLVHLDDIAFLFAPTRTPAARQPGLGRPRRARCPERSLTSMRSPGLVLLLLLAGVAGGVTALRRRLAIVAVDGQSMAPALAPGDRVLVRRATIRAVRPGQVVVVERPGQDGSWVTEPPRWLAGHRDWMIKRVAALPGDPAPEAILPASALGEPVVPAGSLVVLGDNKVRSLDSRAIGYVPADRLLGIMVCPLAARGARAAPAAGQGGGTPR